MRHFLLDTGIAGDSIHRRRNLYERAREEVARGHRIGICVPVLGELWEGVKYGASRDRNAERLGAGKVPGTDRARSLPDAFPRHPGRLTAQLPGQGNDKSGERQGERS